MPSISKLSIFLLFLGCAVTSGQLKEDASHLAEESLEYLSKFCNLTSLQCHEVPDELITNLTKHLRRAEPPKILEHDDPIAITPDQLTEPVKVILGSVLPTDWPEYVTANNPYDTTTSLVNRVPQTQAVTNCEGDLLNFDCEGTDVKGLRQTEINDRVKWLAGIVPYTVDPMLQQPQYLDEITKAIRIIENATCVRFVERSSQPEYVRFRQGDQFASAVGMIGGPQTISVGVASHGERLYGRILETLYHTLGFGHEHNRVDRDNYIFVNLDNVMPENSKHLRKMPGRRFAVETTPYDYDSISHYGYDAFAKDPEVPVILPKIRRIAIGQRDHLSMYDRAKINILYDCKPKAEPIIQSDNTESHTEPVVPPGMDESNVGLVEPSEATEATTVRTTRRTRRTTARTTVTTTKEPTTELPDELLAWVATEEPITKRTTTRRTRKMLPVITRTTTIGAPETAEELPINLPDESGQSAETETTEEPTTKRTRRTIRPKKRTTTTKPPMHEADDHMEGTNDSESTTEATEEPTTTRRTRRPTTTTTAATTTEMKAEPKEAPQPTCPACVCDCHCQRCPIILPQSDTLGNTPTTGDTNSTDTTEPQSTTAEPRETTTESENTTPKPKSSKTKAKITKNKPKEVQTEPRESDAKPEDTPTDSKDETTDTKPKETSDDSTADNTESTGTTTETEETTTESSDSGSDTTESTTQSTTRRRSPSSGRTAKPIVMRSPKPFPLANPVTGPLATVQTSFLPLATYAIQSPLQMQPLMQQIVRNSLANTGLGFLFEPSPANIKTVETMNQNPIRITDPTSDTAVPQTPIRTPTASNDGTIQQSPIRFTNPFNDAAVPQSNKFAYSASRGPNSFLQHSINGKTPFGMPINSQTASEPMRLQPMNPTQLFGLALAN